MKKYFLLLLLLSSSLFAHPRCSSELVQAVHAIYRLPEGKKLLAQVESEGPIQILLAPFNNASNAMWVGDDRAIVLNANNPRSFGQSIRSILFELHNAKTNRQFLRLDWYARNHYISKSDYVKEVERLEHQNARATARIINRAIHKGYFPRDAWWPVPEDFQTHYRIQIQTGHSGTIASLYDALTRSSHTNRVHS